MLVQVQKITKSYGTVPLFEGANLQINAGAKIGLVGPNGSGKSTLMKIIQGIESVDSGRVSRKKNSRIGYLAQTTRSYEQSVRSYLVETFTQINQIQKEVNALAQKMAEPTNDLASLLKKFGQKQDEFQQAGGYEIEHKLEMITNGLVIHHLLDRKFSELSGGEQTIVQLARLLLQDNELILLDEPTNHLDIKRILWLEGYLVHLKKAYIVVSHDRLFLDHVAAKIIEIEDGQIVEYQGNYSEYTQQKESKLEQIRKNFAEQQKEIKKLALAIRRFRQWGHEGDNEKFFKKAKQLEKRLEKIQRIPKPKEPSNRFNKRFKETQRSGKRVLWFEGVSKSYDSVPLFQESTFSLLWQDRVAIIGANGVGKSTLMRLILGREQASSGTIEYGSAIKSGYLPQIIQYKNEKQTLLQNFRQECSESEQTARRRLAKYSFDQEDMTKQIRFLSGGEKIRLELAKLMNKEVNFLLLDEPTNHLDIETREEIEEILQQYTGTLLVISHDRFFLQKLFTTFLVIENQRISKKLGDYETIQTPKN